MDIETSREGMAQELSRLRSSKLATQAGWEVFHEDLLVFVGMRSRRTPGQLYLLRASFDEYPKRAPSILFVDPATKAPSADAWPPGLQHSTNPPGICTPGTREFYEHFHKNQQQHAWDRAKHSLLATVHEIQRLVDTCGQEKFA